MRTALLLLILLQAWPGAQVPDSGLARSMEDGYLQVTRDPLGALVPGPRFAIGEIRIESARGLTPAEMGLSAYRSRPATARNFQEIIDRARGFLLDNGHPFAEISVDFSVPGTGPIADIVLAIDAGSGFKYGGLKQSGSRIRPEPLEKLTLLEYGETYSEERLRKGRERLARTGYFESLFPGPLYRDSVKNLLYPTLALTDMKGNRLGGILGYDSDQDGGGGGLAGFIDIHLINLLGTARDFDFNFQGDNTVSGRSRQEVRGFYVEPWIGGTPVGGQLRFLISLEDSVYHEVNGEIGFFQDMDFQSRYQVFLGSQFNRDFVSGERTSAKSAGLGWVRDSRDRVPETRRGTRISIRLNGIGRDVGDSTYYLVQGLNEAALWSARGRWLFHLLVAGGGNWPLEGRQNRGELHSLGGANTIRGFREKEFLTNLYAYANCETRYQLAPGSSVSAFVVPAFINRSGGSVHWRRVVGYGVGLESATRDWAFGLSYALNPERRWNDGFVHLRAINKF